MENLVTTQDTTSEKKPKYVDIVEIVTEDDGDFIVLAPSLSHIEKGDVVEIEGITSCKATVVQTMDWVGTDSDTYKFLSKMFDLHKINCVWKRKELRWD